jgi:DNA-3-methyladenine glycosylase
VKAIDINISDLELIAGDQLGRFFNRCVDDVAVSLVGKFLTSEIDGKITGGKIIETEAYCEHDFAAHCHANAALRRRKGSHPMRLSGGRIYLYPSRIYHHEGFWCMNFTCGQAGLGSAVLIRALMPLWGSGVMRERRIEGGTPLDMDSGAFIKRLCNGPGVLWESLGCINHELYNGKELADATLKLYRDKGETLRRIAGARILGTLRSNSCSLRAKGWPRRYVDAEILKSKTFAGFLSKPMKDGMEYSSTLLSQLKTSGELKACMCSESSSSA